MINWGKTTREMLGRAHLNLGDRTKGDEKENKWEGRQMDRRKEEWGTLAKESGRGEETIVKAIGVRETAGKVSGGKATGAQVSQVTGGKDDRLMSERESLITVCHQVTRLQDRI